MQKSHIISFLVVGLFVFLWFYSSPGAQDLEVVGSCYFPEHDFARSVYVDGNYAYLTRESEGFYIIDISELTTPIVVAIYDSSGVHFNDVVIRDNLAYLAVCGVGIMIFDVSDPMNPFVLGQSQFNRTGAHAVFIRKNLAYLAHCNRGLTIFDISNPHNPTVIGICYTTYYIAHDVIVYGQYAYMVDYNNGLTIIDVSDPTDPFSTGFYYLNFCNSRLAVLPNIAYLLSFHGNLVIIDTSDPYNPSYISEFSLDPTGSQDIKIADNKAYIAGGGMAILDISNPTDPVILEQYENNIYFTAIFVRNDLLFIAGSHGFFILRYTPSTGVASEVELPEVLNDIYNAPNPFNSSTTINYNLNDTGMVTLTLYNIQGQRVAELLNGILQVGEHSISWDASHNPSGVYFARLEVAGSSRTAKMVLLK